MLKLIFLIHILTAYFSKFIYILPSLSRSSFQTVFSKFYAQFLLQFHLCVHSIITLWFCNASNTEQMTTLFVYTFHSTFSSCQLFSQHIVFKPNSCSFLKAKYHISQSHITGKTIVFMYYYYYFFFLIYDMTR